MIKRNTGLSAIEKTFRSVLPWKQNAQIKRSRIFWIRLVSLPKLTEFRWNSIFQIHNPLTYSNIRGFIKR